MCLTELSRVDIEISNFALVGVDKWEIQWSSGQKFKSSLSNQLAAFRARRTTKVGRKARLIIPGYAVVG